MSIPSQPASKELINDRGILYPVYCTYQVPLEIIAEFMTTTRQEGIILFPIIITSATSHLESYTTSTRLPLDPFESPFLGWDIQSIIDCHKTQSAGLDGSRYGTGRMVILDEQNVNDKTCLVVTLIDESFMTLRSDFDMAPECFQPAAIMGWAFDEFDLGYFYQRPGNCHEEPLRVSSSLGDSW